MSNARDVGGRRLADGRTTRTGVLLRSDAPYAGDAAPAFGAWPPRTIVDLRSAREGHGEHPLAISGAVVHRVPLSADASLDHLLSSAPGSGLVALYLAMLADAGPKFATITALAADGPGPVLVHCAAGKDRTGVAIAVLLAAVGVADEEIVADYVITQGNMGGVIERFPGRGDVRRPGGPHAATPRAPPRDPRRPGGGDHGGARDPAGGGRRRRLAARAGGRRGDARTAARAARHALTGVGVPPPRLRRRRRTALAD